MRCPRPAIQVKMVPAAADAAAPSLIGPPLARPPITMILSFPQRDAISPRKGGPHTPPWTSPGLLGGSRANSTPGRCSFHSFSLGTSGPGHGFHPGRRSFSTQSLHPCGPRSLLLQLDTSLELSSARFHHFLFLSPHDETSIQKRELCLSTTFIWKPSSITTRICQLRSE